MLIARTRRTDRYAMLLGLILLSIASLASTESGWGRATTVVLLSVTLLVALATSGASHRLLLIARVVTVLATVTVIFAAINGGSAARGLTGIIIGMLAAVAPVVIGKEIVRHDRVTFETVLGALCIYLLLGMLFAALCWALAELSGNPFFAETAHPSAAEYVYFSYITVATVGYGDLTPGTDPGRMLSVVAGLCGQLYLVTVVALLVSNLGRDRRVPRD